MCGKSPPCTLMIPGDVPGREKRLALPRWPRLSGSSRWSSTMYTITITHPEKEYGQGRYERIELQGPSLRESLDKLTKQQLREVCQCLLLYEDDRITKFVAYF